MMSPLHPAEFAISLMLISLIRLILGMVPVTLLALFLFGFNIYELGFALLAFFANLVFTSWAVGLVVSGLILRSGLKAQNFAWSLAPTYVFEGMRAALIDGVFRADLMLGCLSLNMIYLSIGFLVFMLLVQSARRKGKLLTLGE